MEAAETVCAWNGLESWDILDLLTALVSKSMVVVRRSSDHTAGQEPRYNFLETIREYAAVKLIESGEQQALGERHLDYWLRWSEQSAAHSISAGQKEWLQRFRLEQDNLRQALGQGLALGRRLDGLRLASRLWTLWEISSQVKEGQDWLHRYLEHPQADYPPADQAQALSRLAWLHVLLREASQANACANASLALQPTGQPAALAYLALGRAVSFSSVDHARALALTERGLAESQEIGDHYLEARGFSLKGVILMFSGQRAAALESFNAAQTLNEQMGEQYIAAESLNFIAMLHQDAGDLQQARQLAEESTLSARRRGFVWLVSHQGWAALAQGDYAAAEVYFREFTDFWHSLGHYENISGMIGLIVTALYQNHDAEGQQLLADLLDLWEQKPIHPEYREFMQPDLDANLGHIYILLHDSPAAHRYLDSQFLEDTEDYNLGELLLDLARLALLDGNLQAAAHHLHSCLQMFIQTTRRTLIVEALEAGAELWARSGRPEQATRCLGTAFAFRQQTGLVLPPRFEPALEAIRRSLCDTLGLARFEQAYHTGQATALDLAAQEALQALALL